jgi:iron complex outermembrane recepter protein
MAIRADITSLAAAIRYSLVMGGAVAGLARPAIAQEVAGGTGVVESPIKVFVTGSNVPAVAGEAALPIQIITRNEIERTNLQTAAQLVNAISATTSFGAFNEAQALGNIGQAGFAGSGLRGLGYQATLVLINGRRVANYAFTTLGGDLNAIPLSAVERVEVLKDGASAIYGSDAVAGVINFILRRNVQGAEVYAQYTSPEHTGGYAKHVSATAGYGDLTTQRFNATMVLDYQAFGGIRARDRAFAARNYIPEEGVDRTNIHSLPANVDTPLGVRNPSGDPANGYLNPTCTPPLSFPTAGIANRYQCRWNGDGSATIFDPSERVGFVGAFAWQIDHDNQLFLDATYTRNRFEFVTWPAQASNQASFPQGSQSFLLPAASVFYPHDFARAFGIDGKPLNVFWSAVDLGSRTIEVVSSQWNVVAGMRGTTMGWTYDGAFDFSRSDVENRAADGNVRQSLLFPILNSGAVNPFGQNTREVVDLLSTARFDGVLNTGKSTMTSLDVKAAKDVLVLPTGSLSLAVGVGARREELVQSADPALETGDILNLGTTPSFSGARNVWGIFAETSVPVLRTLEADVAVRYDRYSDFGGTTNPKLSLRWQPAATLVLRASGGTGYFAPSLAGLHQPPVYGSTTGDPLSDPVRCPVTHSAQDCNRQFPTLAGGNPALLPTRSSQWSVGGVWSPTRDLAIGVDYVSILLDDRINFFFPDPILAQCPDGVSGPTCYLVHRGPVDASFPTLPGPIVQIDQFITNLGKQKATAVDLSVQYTAPKQDWGRIATTFTGTYNIHNMRQQLDGSYVELVNHYSFVGGNPGVVPWWRHHLVLDWSYGPWLVTVDELFQTGTYDQSPGPGTGTTPRFTGDYDVWNARFAYTGFPGWTLSTGIKNLLDRDPPFSNQSPQNFQVGYDPTYADTHGRLYWVSMGYAFR